METMIPKEVLAKHEELKKQFYPKSVYVSYVKTANEVVKDNVVVEPQKGSVVFITHPTREQQIHLMDLMSSKKEFKAHSDLIEYCTLREYSDSRLFNDLNRTEDIDSIFTSHVVNLKNAEIIDIYFGEVKKN